LRGKNLRTTFLCRQEANEQKRHNNGRSHSIPHNQSRSQRVINGCATEKESFLFEY
jgi:hypothetical protein